MDRFCNKQDIKQAVQYQKQAMCQAYCGIVWHQTFGTAVSQVSSLLSAGEYIHYLCQLLPENC